MQLDSNGYSAYFAPSLLSSQPCPGIATMSGSPYPTATQPHSNPHPAFNHAHFPQPGHSVSSYRTHSHQSPLRQASLGYSPYPSDVSAASPESPISSSSANESPLPEPPIDNMDNDMAAHVATGNDDYYPYATEDISLGYPYNHIGSRPLVPAYTLDSPEYYKQPVSAPLPMNISLAMGYSWSPETKKFQPLYPPIQQIQRQHSPAEYPVQPPVAGPVHTATRTTCGSAQPFDQAIDEPDLVHPQLSSRHYTTAPTQLTQQFSPAYSLRQGVSIKQENDISFPDLYNRSADIAGPSTGYGTFRNLLDSAPTDSSLDLALQYGHSPTNQASMNVPVLSAPVPRHSAYFGTSLVNNCERTCQEQEQQQERHALRVRSQGLQEQRTVRPAEVSPIMGVADLPDGGDEDAEGEPDVEPLNFHGGSTTSGHSTVGVYDYTRKFARGSHSGTSSGEDADEVEELNGRDLDYDYRAEEEDDAGDGDFVPCSRTTSKNTRSLRPRSIAGRNPVRYHPYGADVSPSAVKGSPRSPLISASEMSPASSSGQPGKVRKNARTLPIPVPVPNLTKKSRGRRVPTVSGASVGRSSRDAALGARIYLCDVSGCGKCFARGEHLKRHIRSIHTYEKPHKCPYPGCGKEFSRHDNLGQHMKVHKDFPKVMERVRGGEA
ncbi:hypothetical protein J3R82DRAFT_217 [Butyriboletus roseoflavus]|nr:hypothetical protein J3R82DRAFT_217 [Butyriboletus roseoflavus]